MQRHTANPKYISEKSLGVCGVHRGRVPKVSNLGNIDRVQHIHLKTERRQSTTAPPENDATVFKVVALSAYAV